MHSAKYQPGCVQVEVDEQVVTVLKKGSYFGEIGLLRACRRTASIRAVSETVDLFVLSKVTLTIPGSPGARELAALHPHHSRLLLMPLGGRHHGLTLWLAYMQSCIVCLLHSCSMRRKNSVCRTTLTTS